MKKTSFYFLIPLLLTSCLKTTQALKKENARTKSEQNQKVQEVRDQQMQGLYSQLKKDNENLRSEVGRLTNILEEVEHQISQKIQQIDARIEASENATQEQDELIKAHEKKLEGLEEKIKKQATLPKTAKKTPKKTSEKKSTSEKSEYAQAISLYLKRKYAAAKKSHLALLEEKKTSSTQEIRLLHNLGMMNYVEKKYKNALIYFSKVYSKNKKSRYAPNSLLHIGLIFAKQKKNSEAKEIFQQVIQDFPKSSHALTAQGQITKLSS